MNKKEKTGGRILGTPNKRSLEALEVFGDFCPLEKILEKLENKPMEDELYINTCLKLMKFKFPERRAIEYKANFSTYSDEELMKEAELILKEMKGAVS